MFSLANIRLFRRVAALSVLTLFNLSLKNKKIVFSTLDIYFKLGWAIKMGSKKEARVWDWAGQSNRKWDSFSTWLLEHNLQKRWLLSILDQRPVSISSLRVPSLSLVKRDRFFLVTKCVRWGATLKVWFRFLNK